MIGALKNVPGVKPEELKWSGTEDISAKRACNPPADYGLSAYEFAGE